MVELNIFQVDYEKLKKFTEILVLLNVFLNFIQHIFGSVIEISTENSFLSNVFECIYYKPACFHKEDYLVSWSPGVSIGFALFQA